MATSKNCVVFMGMMFPAEIIRHFALFARAERKLMDEAGVDFYFAAVKNATKQNAWPIVYEAFPKERIIDESSYTGVVSRVESLFETYDRVVLHFQGGWSMLKPLCPLKKRFKDRFKIIAVTQYYRNDGWLRIPMSIFQYFVYSKYVDLVNFQSPFSVRKFVGGQKLYQAGKGTVIPMGCEAFPEVRKDAPESLRSAGIAAMLEDDSLFKFVYLAAFRPGKRHEWLVRAVADELKGHPDARLLFCGQGSKACIDNVRAAIRQLHVEEQVILPGQIPHEDLPWLLAHCNCAIIPSVSETFGHAFVEPMMAGLPILGTRVGAGEYVIRDYETGISFELGAPLTLQRGFRVLVENRKATKKMGETARRLAEIMFSFEEVAKMWAGIYLEMLDR